MSLPPGVSMLWEPVEPLPALRERFGLEDFAAAAGWTGALLRQRWGLAVADCRRVVISDQNVIAWVGTDRGPLVVKWSRARERFAALERTALLLRDLGERGLPVAPPVADRHGVLRPTVPGPAGELSVTVVPEVAGDWLDVADLRAVHATGAVLARLHTALGEQRPVPGGVAAAGADEEGPAGRITRWLAASDHGFAPRASERLAELIAAVPAPDEEPQLVHHDVRAANVLVRGSRVAALLDFDEVRLEQPMADLAKAGVLLATRFTDWRPTPPAARRALRAGYASVRPLSPARTRWLEVMELWFGLHAVPGPHDPAGWAAAVETPLARPGPARAPER